MVEARYVVEGVTVRFFKYRTDAMKVAALMTGHMRVGHSPKQYAPNDCYIVLNDETQDVFDASGKVPDPASTAIRAELAQ